MTTLPLTRGKAPVHRVYSIYADMYKSVYGIYPTWNSGKLKVIKDLLDTYSELQLAVLIIVFLKDNDKYLSENGHPLFNFRYNLDKYIAQVRVKEGLAKEFDSSDELLPIIRENILKVTTQN